jgi:hypothetical protein
MLFNLFKKKKEDELDLGDRKVKLSSPVSAGNQPKPSSMQLRGGRIQGNQIPRTTFGMNQQQTPSFSTPKTTMQGGQQVPQLSAGKSLSQSSIQQGIKPPSIQKATPPPAETPPPMPQKQQSPQQDPLAKYRQLGQDRQSFLGEQRDQAKNYYDQAYGERNRLLGEYIPQLQKQFAGAKGAVQQGMGMAEQDAEMQKQRATDEWGESQRLAAQTRQEGEQRTRGKFADLNTSDSFGYGSHQEAQENLESDFNRFTQQGLRQKEQNLFEVDRALQDYKIQAQQQVDNMEIDLNNAIMQIQSDMRMNDIEKQNAMNQVINQYQEGVLNIRDNIEQLQMQYDMSLQELENSQLSPEFMSTGQPQTENDYRYFMENYDQYKDMIGGDQDFEQQAQRGDTISLIDDVLNSGKTKPLTGNIRFQGIPLINRMDVADTKAKLNQIKSQLELANAAAMKGQGAMSDAERKILSDAALALNPDNRGTYRVSDEQLRQTLEQAKNILARQGAAQTGATQVDPYQFVR